MFTNQVMQIEKIFHIFPQHWQLRWSHFGQERATLTMQSLGQSIGPTSDNIKRCDKEEPLIKKAQGERIILCACKVKNDGKQRKRGREKQREMKVKSLQTRLLSCISRRYLEAELQSLNVLLETLTCLHFDIQKHKYDLILCEFSENAAKRQNQTRYFAWLNIVCTGPYFAVLLKQYLTHHLTNTLHGGLPSEHSWWAKTAKSAAQYWYSQRISPNEFMV